MPTSQSYSISLAIKCDWTNSSWRRKTKDKPIWGSSSIVNLSLTSKMSVQSWTHSKMVFKRITLQLITVKFLLQQRSILRQQLHSNRFKFIRSTVNLWTILKSLQWFLLQIFLQMLGLLSLKTSNISNYLTNTQISLRILFHLPTILRIIWKGFLLQIFLQILGLLSLKTSNISNSLINMQINLRILFNRSIIPRRWLAAKTNFHKLL